MSQTTITRSKQQVAEKKKIRILSIDGGGIKGILPAALLSYLEKALQKESRNPDARIADYFDFFAGTSTGGILVSTLLTPDLHNPGRPKYKAEDAMNFYFTEGPKIFSRSLLRRIAGVFGWFKVKYDGRKLELGLQEKIGRNTMLSDMLKPVMLPSYEISQRKAMFYTSLNAQENANRDFKVWQVAYATSAAPTYFKPAQMKGKDGTTYTLIDGGMFANNPAMCAFIEAKKIKQFQKANGEVPSIDDIMVVSLGTGARHKRYSYDKMKTSGKANWIKPVINIQMSGNAQTVDHQLGRLYDERTNGANNDYYRIMPDLYKADTDMDNASKKNLKRLKEAGDKNVASFKATLDEIARKLVANDPNTIKTPKSAEKKN